MSIVYNDFINRSVEVYLHVGSEQLDFMRVSQRNENYQRTQRRQSGKGEVRNRKDKRKFKSTSLQSVEAKRYKSLKIRIVRVIKL